LIYKNRLLLTIFSVRDSINNAWGEYDVTSKQLPVFLYEDPENHDPDDIFKGLFHGPYLLKVRD